VIDRYLRQSEAGYHDEQCIHTAMLRAQVGGIFQQAQNIILESFSQNERGDPRVQHVCEVALVVTCWLSLTLISLRQSGTATIGRERWQVKFPSVTPFVALGPALGRDDPLRRQCPSSYSDYTSTPDAGRMNAPVVARRRGVWRC
jgi:hypothetical protein